MPSSYEQITKQLDRLSLVMEPPQAKILNGKPNPKYGAVVGVYVDCLQPFQPWELEAGIKLALENHRFKSWPKPAELREWCLQAQREFRKPDPKPQSLPKPEEKPRLSPEERERIGYQLQVMGEYWASGNWGTLEDCKAEARRRQESQTSRLSQTS